METYLTLLYVTLEQEVALKEYFKSKGWTYNKPDLSVITDRVGPFGNPQAFKTKSGKLGTDSEVSTNDSNDRSINVISVLKKGRKEPADISDVVKVEVSCEKDIASGEWDGYEDIDESIENDDGDNDDDYADDFNYKVDEGKKNLVSDNMSSEVQDRSSTLTENIKNTESEQAGHEQTINAAGRKRRKVAANTGQTMQAVTLDEKEERDKTSSVVDKHYLRQLLTEALRSSRTGKESCKTDFSTCPYCQKSIRNTNLRRHFLTHLDLPYRCTRCSSYFKSQDELEKHRLEKHIGEFICPYCGVKYRFKSSLTEHIQTRHEGTAKMYQCTVCSVRMCRKSHMDDHMNIHKNVNPYSCQNCSKSYKNKSAFKRHSKDCGSGIKYVCSFCGQIYKSSAGLQDHIKRCHDGSKNILFSCLCGTSFKSRAARCRHRFHCEKYQRDKNGTQPDLVNQNISILNVTSSANEQTFYGSKALLSQADKETGDQENVGQNVRFELIEVTPGEMDDTDTLQQGQLLVNSETCDEISRATSILK